MKYWQFSSPLLLLKSASELYWICPAAAPEILDAQALSKISTSVGQEFPSSTRERSGLNTVAQEGLH